MTLSDACLPCWTLALRQSLASLGRKVEMQLTCHSAACKSVHTCCRTSNLKTYELVQSANDFEREEERMPFTNVTVAVQGVVASFAWMILTFLGWHGEPQPHHTSLESMMAEIAYKQTLFALGPVKPMVIPPKPLHKHPARRAAVKLTSDDRIGKVVEGCSEALTQGWMLMQRDAVRGSA